MNKSPIFKNRIILQSRIAGTNKVCREKCYMTTYPALTFPLAFTDIYACSFCKSNPPPGPCPM